MLDDRNGLGCRIIVERDRSVVVRAPLHISKILIDKEIQKRKRLLQNKIDHNQKYSFEKTGKEFVSGESLMFLGGNYKLYVQESEKQGIIFDNKFIISKNDQKRANKLSMGHL